MVGLAFEERLRRRFAVADGDRAARYHDKRFMKHVRRGWFWRQILRSFVKCGPLATAPWCCSLGRTAFDDDEFMIVILTTMLMKLVMVMARLSKCWYW